MGLYKNNAGVLSPISGTPTKAIESINNPNLIDNPWFTINQRGQSSYSGDVYTVDRWHIQADMTLSISDGVITLSNSGTNNYRNCYQLSPIDDYKAILGKKVTISILLSDGTIESTTKELSATLPSDWVSYATAIGEWGRIGVMLHPNYFQAYIGMKSGQSVSFKAFKVEVGELSTLALDIAPNYPDELAKCQTRRYSGDSYTDQGNIVVSKSNGILGAKNFIPNTAKTTTVDGVTYTVNSDESITVSGTASSESWYYVTDFIPINYPNNTYVFSGVGTTVNTQIFVALYDANLNYLREYRTTSQTPEVLLSQTSDAKYMRVDIVVGASLTASGTAYPMLRLATDKDSTYQPYALTNRQLTKVDDDVSGSYLHFYKVGRLVMCVVVGNSITMSSGASLGTIPDKYLPIQDCHMTENLTKSLLSVSKASKSITTNVTFTSQNIRATQTWISAY